MNRQLYHLRKIKAHSYWISCILLVSVAMFFSCTEPPDSVSSEDAGPVLRVPFTAVKITDDFWADKIEINRKVTIPIAIHQCYFTGRVDNFMIAGGLKEGKYQTQMPFDDTDIYKLIEAASYSLQTKPDPYLEARLDTLIEYIALAQEDDGYLYTGRTIDPENPHPWADSIRWTGAAKGWYGSHELYNCGHLFEAATAHYAATGKESLLNVAIKAADLLLQDFGPGKLQFGPGHQVVEMGLVRMYDATGKREYLDLSKFFLDVRGPGGEEYSQAHKKVVDQREPVGHAVRATYMYSAMADIAARYDEKAYMNALNAIWNDLVTKKIYITGGIGSGGGNEGFDEPYELPNMSAYCETCASVGNINWNHRMFFNDGNADYVDVLERTLYNAFLSGVSLSGDRFFYPNVLESLGQHERGAWFGTACCPPNVARTLPSLPGYVYAKSNESVYVNLYMSNLANIDLNGKQVGIVQETRYPWEGDVNITLNPAEPMIFKLKARIPAWVKNDPIPGDLYAFADNKKSVFSVLINGQKADYNEENGYAVIEKKWKEGDQLQLRFDMEPRVVVAHDSVTANRDKIAIQRGPIVYAAEWPDAGEGNVLNLVFDQEQQFKAEYKPELLDGVMVVKARAKGARAMLDGDVEMGETQEIQLIPYYSWNNRGAGEMMVWLPVNEKSMRPLPSPTVASKSEVTGSRNSKTLVALNDQLLPSGSNDHSWPFYHWWPENDSWQWVQYDFDEGQTISSSKVYWFDDGPNGGCRIPASWELLYKDGDIWNPVETTSSYIVVKDDWSMVEFKPVKTTALKLRVKLPEEHSAGIHEWVIN